MAVDTLEAKAQELLGQLNPDKLAAVVHLLEVMVHDEDDEEELTEEDRRAIAASRDYFRHGGQGLSFERSPPNAASPWIRSGAPRRLREGHTLLPQRSRRCPRYMATKVPLQQPPQG